MAIDLMGGKCVRLTQGDFSTKKVYGEDPLSVAMAIEEAGLNYLHLVDLDGAKNRKPENLAILEKIAAKTKLQIDYGGGIRTYGDISSALSAGAAQVTVGSVAVTDPGLFAEWLDDLGGDKLILGADFSGRKISTNGWLSQSDMDIISFISGYQSKGVRYVLCTDISRDGMLNGPSTGVYSEILGKVSVNLIASGGISSVHDIENLKDAGCEGAIVGKAFYEGRLTLNQLKNLC